MAPAILPRPAGSNVVQLAAPSRAPEQRPAARVPFAPGFPAAAGHLWTLQLALAWSYPRFCYAVWSQWMTLPSRQSDR